MSPFENNDAKRAVQVGEHSDIFANWQEIQQRIAEACARCSRQPQHIRLLGAAKTVVAARLQQFITMGLGEVGENYVQEAVQKKAALGQTSTLVQWHLIGALQSNKAKIAVREFNLIHSIDRLSLAQSFDKAAGAIGKRQDVLLQVNVGDETTKAGCAPAELIDLAQACAALPNLRVQGLMCLPPYDEDPEKTRPYFRQLRELRDELKAQNLLESPESIGELSMGMSDDFEVAIEEGATIIRLGTALFGRRDKAGVKK